MSTDLQQVSRTFAEKFDAIFNTPDVNIADEIFAENFVGYLPLAPGALDREGWKAYVQSFYDAFPDMRETIHEVIVSQDRIVLRVSYTGTHQGELFGHPPTGRQVNMPGIGIFRFDANGKAVENRAVIDVAGLLMQIGALSVPGPA